jgi:hypothetical protein
MRSIGELAIASANKRVFQLFPVKHLILYVLPFLFVIRLIVTPRIMDLRR